MLDGPVYLLGEVIKVLIQALDGAVPGLDARVAADALIGAVADNYGLHRTA